MIICKESRSWGAKNGVEVLDVWLVTDATPAEMPTSSDAVENMPDGKLFAPGSVMIIVGSGNDNGDVYFYNEGWYKWS